MMMYHQPHKRPRTKKGTFKPKAINTRAIEDAIRLLPAQVLKQEVRK